MLTDREASAIRAELPTLSAEHAVWAARQDRLKVMYDQVHFGVWSSPNRVTLPTPVPDFEEFIPFTARNRRRIRWMRPLLPFLGFMPLYPRWTGVLACLDATIEQLADNIRHITVARRYYLHESIRSEWEQLEYKMLTLARRLIQRHVRVHPQESEIQNPELPSQSGYRDTFYDYDQMYSAVLASKNAFITLSAFLSFAIAIDMSKNPSTSVHDPPSWVAFAESELNFDPSWVNGLRDTFVCDFSRGFRCGSYLLYSTPIFSEIIDAYLVADVGLFVCWSYWPRYLRPEAPLWRLRPCHAEAKRAIDVYSKEQLSQKDDNRGRYNWWYNMIFFDMYVSEEDSKKLKSLPYAQKAKGPAPALIPRQNPDQLLASTSTNTYSHHDQPAAPTSPALHSHSSPDFNDDPSQGYPFHDGVVRDSPLSPHPQTTIAEYRINPPPDVWWREYQQRKAEFLAVEDYYTRLARDEEKEAEKENADPDCRQPQSGIYMFEWFPISHDRYKLELVDSSDWRKTWGRYKPGNRRFDAIHQEWHLIRDDDIHLMDDIEAPQPMDGVLDDGHRSSVPDEPVIDVYDDYMGSSDNGESDSDDVERRKRRRKSKKVNKGKKKGKIQPTPSQPSNDNLLSHTNPPQPSTSQLTHAVSTPLPPPPPPAPVVTFDTIHVDVPSMLNTKFALLVPDNVEDGEIPSGRETRMTAALGILTIHPQLTPAVRSFIHSLYTHLTATDGRTIPKSVCALSSNTQALVSRHDVLLHRQVGEHHFIGAKGYGDLWKQFYIVRLSSARAVLEVFRTTPPFSSHADMVRYFIANGIPFQTVQASKTLRPALKSPVHGLGFRNEKYVFGPQDWQSYREQLAKLLSGPAGRAAIMRGGVAFRIAKDIMTNVNKQVLSRPSFEKQRVGEAEGFSLFDDTLSEEEEDLISGVYRVYTGNRQQTEHKSWFPKVVNWENSTSNPGYWSVDNEDWYRKRVHDIESGVGTPLSGSQWRTTLRTKVQRKVFDTFKTFSETTAERALKGDMGFLADAN